MRLFSHVPAIAESTFRRGYASSASSLKKTCLYDLHVKHGGKMVPFAGFSMPVQYTGDLSIKDSCKHTRSHVSIFDVSHMLQTEIRGDHREDFMESLTTADIVQLPAGQGVLSVFTNPKGGIRDDLILSKTDSNCIYMVTNAGCIEKDLPYLQENAAKWHERGKDVQVDVLDQHGLIAVQGPEMVKLLREGTDVDLQKLYFMHTTVGTIFGVKNCRVTRCGYTGEDGVEISVPGKDIEKLVGLLLNSKIAAVKLAGLGARDALRLEAGLCLYGNDITEDTNPVEAALAFVVAKRRRQTLGFPGAEKIVEQLEKKNYAKRRVGLISDGGRAPRSHLPIVDPMNKAAIGFVTSGCPSPCLDKNIGMGYVDTQDAKEGKVVDIDFGPKIQKVTVCKLPFVPTKYYMEPKKRLQMSCGMGSKFQSLYNTWMMNGTHKEFTFSAAFYEYVSRMGLAGVEFNTKGNDHQCVQKITYAHNGREDQLIHCFKSHGPVPEEIQILCDARLAADDLRALQKVDYNEDGKTAT